MQLIIAEKPSVAADIARVLGVKSKKTGYFESSVYIITWCIGHLVGLANPDDYDERYKKWAYEDLPIFPEQWKFVLNSSTKKQFDVIKTLMNDKRVESVVCATDAGREGELIFRYVYLVAKCKKAAYRLWTSSLEDKAILKGMQQLKRIEEYDNLYNSGHCRGKADWLVGMNLSRVYTIAYRPEKPYAVGRVMTPTLNMIVERFHENKRFKSVAYYQSVLKFEQFDAISGRFASEQTAEALSKKCMGVGNALVESIEQLQKSEGAPKLYDLTALQRDCNKLFGYSAKQTLEYAQNLYERKLLTYPRTDSRFLTDDMHSIATETAQAVRRLFVKKDVASERLFEAMGVTANIKENIPNILNSKKVSDHHAIMPTMTLLNSGFDSLSQAEKNIVQQVSLRLLCAIGGKHIYEATTVNIVCGDTDFQAKGKVVIDDGWKGVLNVWNNYIEHIGKKAGKKTEKQDDEEAMGSLPKLYQGETLPLYAANVKKGTTQPPKLYREDTLLSAMERAGNDSLDNPNEVERKGLGTPATRADTIEKLISTGYVERTAKKDLIPTERGIAVVKVIAPELLDAKLTAEWENKLTLIAKGKIAPNIFMDEIEGFVRKVVTGMADACEKAKAMPRYTETVIGKCPYCGCDVVEDKIKMSCKGNACRFAIFKNNRFFAAWGIPVTTKMVQALIANRKAEVMGKSNKTKKSYKAVVTMGDIDQIKGYISFDIKTS